MEETGRQIICASPTTIGVKGQMMVMMMEWKDSNGSVCNITYITLRVLATLAKCCEKRHVKAVL
ncbi:hypothetical protein, partial [Thiolapillus sp.]|uniref:hypothetical protein n=1 Tax=Thiolapillus sp. TaxID=2017437 RepID=UPI003AF631A4